MKIVEIITCSLKISTKVPLPEGLAGVTQTVLIIIIIITLFQEDNIFGTDASLTYGPQIQRHTCV